MNPQYIEIVKTIFSELSDADLSLFINAAHLKSYPPNYMLCTENANEDVFYVIVEGEVAVYKQLTEATKKTLLENKKSGDCFGEMALLLGEPRTADVITTIESSFLEINMDAFLQLIHQNRAFMGHMQQLARRYKANHSRTRQTQTVGAAQIKTVFTSYAREDADFVLKLVEDLQKHLENSSLLLWLDQTHISAGEEWDVAVENALDNSVGMLLIISDKSVASRNVKSEWSYCLDSNKQIIPVLKESCKVPLRLRNLHYIDFASLRYETALARTRDALLSVTK